MLKGQAIDAFAGHLPLLHDAHASPRVHRWKCLLEECSPRAYHTPGAKNDAADAMPRLPMEQDGYEDEAKEWEIPNPPLQHEEEKFQHALLPMASQGDLISKEFPMAPGMLKSHQERGMAPQEAARKGLKKENGEIGRAHV